MSPYIIFLITQVYEGSLQRTALKVHYDYLIGDMRLAPLEPENREQFMVLLPEHVQRLGPIVQVEEIFEAVFLKERSKP